MLGDFVDIWKFNALILCFLNCFQYFEYINLSLKLYNFVFYFVFKYFILLNLLHVYYASGNLQKKTSVLSIRAAWSPWLDK